MQLNVAEDGYRIKCDIFFAVAWNCEKFNFIKSRLKLSIALFLLLFLRDSSI